MSHGSSFLSHTEGLILHRYPFKQTVLVKLLTSDRGLLPLVVKWGSLAQTKALKQMTVQPFTCVMGEISGLGEVKTLKNIELIENLAPESYKAKASAFYLSELVLTFVRSQEHYPQLLFALKKSLSELSLGALEPTLRSFESFLMNQVGYQLILTEDDRGRSIDRRALYQCLPGALPRLVSQVLSDAQRPILGETLLKIHAEEWSDPNCLKEAKYLFRQWIDYHAEGKKFKTRELFISP